jgi:hypothetical protein
VPYTLQTQRPDIDEVLLDLPPICSAGRLTYILSEVIVKYLIEKGITFQTIDEIKGALGETADEFHDRVHIPYEKMKKSVNGDTSYEIVDKMLLELGCELRD